MKPEGIQELVRKYEPRVLRLVPDGCWTIPGLGLAENGYLRLGRDKVRAHRAFYECARGLIPAGLTLDHLCRNRACINPDHLEAVTHKVNVLRGLGVTAQRARQTECARGHAFDKVDPRGGRKCSECNRIATRELRLRNLEAMRAKDRAYRQANRERVNAYHREKRRRAVGHTEARP
jgi:hypothetical protein